LARRGLGGLRQLGSLEKSRRSRFFQIILGINVG
jgi:hypothetical protein